MSRPFIDRVVTFDAMSMQWLLLLLPRHFHWTPTDLAFVLLFYAYSRRPFHFYVHIHGLHTFSNHGQMDSVCLFLLVCRLSFAVCHLPFAVCHLPFVVSRIACRMSHHSLLTTHSFSLSSRTYRLSFPSHFPTYFCIYTTRLVTAAAAADFLFSLCLSPILTHAFMQPRTSLLLDIFISLSFLVNKSMYYI